MIKKQQNGQWLADFRPWGSEGQRIRKRFRTKAEAERFVAFKKNEAIQKPWEPKRSDNRYLSEIIDLWYSMHGSNLKSGVKTKNRLDTLAGDLGNPLARLVTPKLYMQTRTSRIQNGAKRTSENVNLACLKSVYNELNRLDCIKYECPIKNVKHLKVQEDERQFLCAEQIRRLLNGLKAAGETDLYVTARTCLETGARWSEAYNLKESDIIGKRISFKETKSGKIREIPIREELIELLNNWIPSRQEKRARYLEQRFARYLKKLAISTSYYQATHVLRHSFASHYIMNGGDILALKKILGHSTIEMTMKYAHLSPDHLQTATTLNPVSSIGDENF